MDKEIEYLFEAYEQYKEKPFDLTAILLYDDCLWNLEDYLSEYDIDLPYELLLYDSLFKELLMEACYYCNYDWSIGVGYDEVVDILSETVSSYIEKHRDGSECMN